MIVVCCWCSLDCKRPGWARHAKTNTAFLCFVGKTYFAKSLAKVLSTVLVEVNLNSFTEANSVAGLRGTSAGYKGVLRTSVRAIRFTPPRQVF